MALNQELLTLMRNNAKEGMGTANLIRLIKKHSTPNEFNSFFVMNCFIQAFDLSLKQVRELSGAYALGGEVYSDEKIDELINPLLKNC